MPTIVRQQREGEAVFDRPAHPYTQGLLYSMPRLVGDRGRAAGDGLKAIPGSPPPAGGAGPGCAFAPRCAHRFPRCEAERPAFTAVAPGRRVACHLETPP